MVRGNAINSIAQQEVYVNAQTGSDTVGIGNGSAMNPWATITFANSQITDNTTNKRYAILLGGRASEAAITVKPFVSIIGWGYPASQIVVTGGANNVTLDSSWSGVVAGSVMLKNINFNTSTNISFILTGVAGSDANIFFQDCLVNAGGDFTFTGRNNDDDCDVWNLEVVGDTSITDADFASTISVYTGTASFTTTNSTNAINWRSTADDLNGNVTVTETSGQDATMTLIASNVEGSVTVSGNLAGVLYDAISYPQAGVTLASGGQVFVLASQSYSPIGANTYTGAAYTFVLTDQESYIRFDRGTAQTITVPANSTVAYPIGTEINGIQAGAGQVTFVAAGGVTLNSKGAVLSISGQFGGFSLKKYGTDTWDLVVA